MDILLEAEAPTSLPPILRRRTMKQLLALIAFCLVFVASGLARQAQPAPPAQPAPQAQSAQPAQASGPDSPATKEDVEAYFQVMHSLEMMTKMMDAMSTPIHQMVHQEYLRNKEKLPADFEARQDKEIDDLMKNMPFDEIYQAMIPSYQKHLTKGDLQAMVAFYTSPAGQKLLNEMPAIMSDAMQAAMPIMQRYIDTVQARVQQEIQVALKQGPNPPANPPPTTQN